MSRKIFKVLLGLVLVFLPAYVLRFSIAVIPTTALELLVYAAFILFLISKSYKKIKTPVPVYLGGLFAVAGLLGALADPNLASGLGLWKAYFFDGFLVMLMALSIKKEDIEDYLHFIVASGLITTTIAFALYSNGIKSADNRLLDFDRLSPNYLAMFLAPILVISVAQMIKFFKRDQLFWVYLFASVSFATALYFTGSRGGYIAVAAGLVVVIFSQFMKGKRAKMTKILLATTLVLLLGATLYVFQPDWTSHTRKATSSNVRFYIWSTSIEMIERAPVFGVGLSNYQTYFSDLTQGKVNYPEFITPQALTAHNLYLQIYLTAGLLGLLTFLLLIFKTGFWRLDNVALSAALTSILILGLFDTPFYRNDLALEFFVIIAFIYLSQKKLTRNV